MSEWMEFTGKTVEDALTEALIKLEATSDKVTYEVIEKENNGILGLFAKKDARIRIKLNDDVRDTVKEFLVKVFKAMDIEAEISIDYNEETSFMNIELIGSDMGILIGKRGQTLDSLQYLTNLVANKDGKNFVKVKIDTENYRQRRRDTLENLARNIAHKVKRTRKNVVLEPMNPYERRIIHSALQGDRYVETHSEGDEPYRKVVVTLKKGVDDNYSGGYRRKNYGYKNNKGGYRYNRNNRRESFENDNNNNDNVPDFETTQDNN
ncbi:MAG: protein jag [Lachnospiraceae bacterium]|nr:protein jag [Lachnospiraceae bacterium]